MQSMERAKVNSYPKVSQVSTGHTPLEHEPFKMGILSRASFKYNDRIMLFQNTDGPYLDGLALELGQTTLMTSIIRKGVHAFYDRWPSYSYQFSAKNIVVAEIPSATNLNPGIVETASMLVRAVPVMWQAIKACDAVGIFMPGMRSVIASLICRFQRKPYWTYLGSDWAGMASSTFRWDGWRRKLLFPIYVKLVDFLAWQIQKGASFRLVTGQSLWRKYQYGDSATYKTRPLVSLSADQLYHRKDTCLAEKVRLLCVANLHQRKGHRFLLEALALLQDSGVSCELVVVGDGRERENLEMLVDRLGVQSRVRFEGYLTNGPELWKQYSEADIFVLSSLGEGLPRVIFEAMAHCLPVICSDVSGLSEQFANGQQVIFVPPEQPHAIVDAVIKLRTDPILRQALITNGYEYAKEMIRETAVEQTLCLIRKHIAK